MCTVLNVRVNSISSPGKNIPTQYISGVSDDL